MYDLCKQFIFDQLLTLDKQVGHNNWKCILQNKFSSDADK